MLKRKTGNVVNPRKKIKKSNITKSNVALPNELIIEIFNLLSYKDKRKFKFLNCGFNKLYWEYIETKKYLDPKKHVLYTRGRRPEFYEFHRIFVNVNKKKYFEFIIDQKKVRRQMNFTEKGIPYCRVPTIGCSMIYKLDRSEMDYVGKSYCDRCEVFDYCDSRRFWFFESCYLENCLIEKEEYDEVIDGQLVGTISYETHHHNLCNNCNLR